jgi:hypothetical protein
MRRRFLVGGAIVLVLAVAGGLLVGVRLWRDLHHSSLEQALALAPKDGQRYSWTDWDAVRHEVGASVGPDSSAAQIGHFVAKAEDADLTDSSALAETGNTMQDDFGFSPATVDSELLVGQPLNEGAGQVDLLRLPDADSFTAVRDALTRLGYRVPGEADGVWDGSDAQVAQTETLLSYVALDQDDHVVLISDDRDTIGRAVDALGSGGDLPDGIAQVAGAIGNPLSAEIDSGAYLCNALALSRADPSDQAEGNSLIAAAGEVNPVLGFALSVQPGDGGLLAAMSFADHDQAKTNADTRSRLAVGPAAGQGSGDFTDLFTLGEVRADNDVVTMRLQPKEDRLYSDLLSGGPILFATC